MTSDLSKPRHRQWLDSRNEISRIINDDETLGTAQIDKLCVATWALEKLLLQTQPENADEMAAVMTFALQITAEGSELDEDIAARIVAQARSVICLGSLSGASYDLRHRFAEGASAWPN